MKRRRRAPLPERPPGFEQWAAGEFEVAKPYSEEGIEVVAGWTYRGLGLYRYSVTKARYRRKDGTRRLYESWSITHLNTGHAVRAIWDCPAARAFMLATDLADLGDWNFDGRDGWKNTWPDLPDCLEGWHGRHAMEAIPAGAGFNEGIARAIGSKRW